MEREDEELMDQEGAQGQEMDQWECAGEMNLKGLMDQGKMMVQEAKYLKELLMVKGRSGRKEVLMEAPRLSELNGLVLMDLIKTSSCQQSQTLRYCFLASQSINCN